MLLEKYSAAMHFFQGMAAEHFKGSYCMTNITSVRALCFHWQMWDQDAENIPSTCPFKEVWELQVLILLHLLLQNIQWNFYWTYSQSEFHLQLSLAYYLCLYPSTCESSRNRSIVNWLAKYINSSPNTSVLPSTAATTRWPD